MAKLEGFLEGSRHRMGHCQLGTKISLDQASNRITKLFEKPSMLLLGSLS